VCILLAVWAALCHHVADGLNKGGDNMSVALRRQRDGTLRKFWYGEYVESDGRRKVVNVGTWRGNPPPALLGTGDQTTGDAEFEESRKEAENELAAYKNEARRKGRAEHLIERLIEAKTGAAPEYCELPELPGRWLSMARDSKLSEGYSTMCRAIFGRFIAFMAERNPAARFLYQVKPADANAFAATVRDTMSPKTYREHLRLLRPAFDRFLPSGAVNPFRAAILKRHREPNGGSGESVHRKPFTPEELKALVDAAKEDAFMCGLIAAAACTGMRRGDVCRLRWADVDLDAGMLTVKTSKTGAAVEIPIFAPFRAVLESRKGKNKEHVFPEAARMLAENPDGLTWRFKKIVARTFKGEQTEAAPEPDSAADMLAEGEDAIRQNVSEGERRERILDTWKRYAAGESVRAIEKATGRPRATVSTDLHAVENWTGKRFMRSGQPDSVKKAIASLTRAKREQGKRAASVRDWHALRTTFVTLALSAGVPLELVRRVTGHATVEVVLRHYFRPDREQFRAALTGALPGILTGGTPAKAKPAEELATLAGKLAAGTATKEDKKRLRLLAAKV
jgi:integrase